MNSFLCFPVLLLLSCSVNGQTYPSQNISSAEHIKNEQQLHAAEYEGQSRPADNTILLGYKIGMKKYDCDQHTQKLADEGQLKRSGNEESAGEFLFDFGDSTTTPIDISASDSDNYPRISFTTPRTETDMLQVTALRNRFIEWAIKTYGDAFHVTILFTYVDGTKEMQPTNLYTWIIGSYKLEIHIVSKRVALNYKLNK